MIGGEFPADRYRRAARLSEPAVRGLVRNVSVRPSWVGAGDRFRYERQRRDGTRELIEVDPSSATRHAVAPAATSTESAARSLSPDGHWELRERDGKLLIAAVGSGELRTLTTDGEPDWGYGTRPGSSLVAVTSARSGVELPPVAVWSPDSRRILTHRLDQRQVPELHLLQSVPDEGFRPVLHSYRMPFPGDALATAQLLVIDVLSGAVTPLDAEPLLVEFVSPLELGWAWWGGDGGTVWFLREARGAKRLALCAAQLEAGTVREVIAEQAAGYVEPDQLLPWRSGARLVRGDAQIVWPSERDGRRHLYLLDAADGAVIRRLTEGEWLVRDVLRADDQFVWFTGLGREPGIDPYYRLVYRLRLDGGEPELLTPEAADHDAIFSPSGEHFVDCASTASSAPVARLRAAGGELKLKLEEADLSGLEAAGWRAPERFQLRLETELYGALFLPSDFDASVSYPVIDSIYPGPQLIRTPVSFAVDSTLGPDQWPGQWGAQALAELGFVVVTLDAPGTPLRDRGFHQASVGRLQEYSLDHHIAAIRALAAERPWMDLDRVGIVGHSGGGAAAVRAVIEHGDFFKAAVAGSGNHDLRRYIAYWAEKYQGYGDAIELAPASNIEQAHRLQRPLLLLHGELDDNVHPANTLALVDALIRADRDFELVVIPGVNHACDTHPYYARRMWDFCVRHLLGREPPSADARRRALTQSALTQRAE